MINQYVMIYSIKSFLYFNKDSTNEEFIIYCLFNFFSKANYCMRSIKLFWNVNFFYIKPFVHSKIPLIFCSLILRFSILLSKFDSREICILLAHSHLEPFLWTVATLEIYKLYRKIPIVKNCWTCSYIWNIGVEQFITWLISIYYGNGWCNRTKEVVKILKVTKKLLKSLGNSWSFGLVRNSPLLLRIFLKVSHCIVFTQIIDLILFHVFWHY